MTDIQENIRKNAEMVVEQMAQVCGFDFGYDARSVEWLDGYIERQRNREGIDQDFIHRLVNARRPQPGISTLRHEGHWPWQPSATHHCEAIQPFRLEFLIEPHERHRDSVHAPRTGSRQFT